MPQPLLWASLLATFAWGGGLPSPAQAALPVEQVDDEDGFGGLRPRHRCPQAQLDALGPAWVDRQDLRNPAERWRFWFPGPGNHTPPGAELDLGLARTQAWGLVLHSMEGQVQELWVGANPLAEPSIQGVALGAQGDPWSGSHPLRSLHLRPDAPPTWESPTSPCELVLNRQGQVVAFHLPWHQTRATTTRRFLRHLQAQAAAPDPEAQAQLLALLGSEPLIFQAEVLRVRSLGGPEAGRAEVAFALPVGFQHRPKLSGGEWGAPSQVVVDEWVPFEVAQGLRVGQRVAAEAALILRDGQASKAWWVEDARFFSAVDPRKLPELPSVPYPRP